MREKEALYVKINRQFRVWKRINACIDGILLSAMLFLIAFMGSELTDGIMLLEDGRYGTKYHSFDQLLRINPDTAGWLILDGTDIDYPVVRSKDNFDYLDKDFEGNYYAGGTLFMDKGNRSFEDTYCIIHGHHMAAGVMFGDLERFLEPAFFENNQTGKLLTPSCDYDIRVFACGVFDAYDSGIYRAGDTVPHDRVRVKAVNIRGVSAPAHVLALSTCSDEMTDNRVVVFCELINRRPHE